jgi:dolichol-phosphate mannosyltransferase|tara:strand:+ start:163 stop:876 length:714 start_codon:yes stop_codon:yes gene_type:complete
MSSKTSIILCTYNEANYIEHAILELEKNIPNLEIVIVDDSSSDGTIEIIKKLNQKNKYKVIYRNKSRSLASAFARGVIETTGENIGWIDTNMGKVASKFPEMIKALQSNNDIIVLSRYVDGGGDRRILLRTLSSKYFNSLCRIILRIPIKDFTSSIFLMKRKILDEVTFLGYGHGEFFFEFLYNAHKKGFKIKEIPYVQDKDEDLGNSKSASSAIKFFYLGFMYILRIIITLMRRRN